MRSRPQALSWLNAFNMRLILVGPILQHNAAPAHAGFVSGLASARKRSVDPWYKRMRHAASWRDLMNNRTTPRVSRSGIPPRIARDDDTSSALVDSAISHCEKLRRVLELQEWIDGTRDDPLLATTCRKWKEEREQLLRELHLDQLDTVDVGSSALAL
jgi:hypothetical protein